MEKYFHLKKYLWGKANSAAMEGNGCTFQTYSFLIMKSIPVSFLGNPMKLRMLVETGGSKKPNRILS